MEIAPFYHVVAASAVSLLQVAAEDLPSGLVQLQLVNVGFKSSKKPLPCPKLQHLRIERCKAARAFRLPDISRCVLGGGVGSNVGSGFKEYD
jgi:hypothetical protein